MEKKWWKEGVVYQIYPRSFKDSNGDGIGDLRGIIEKLDYLKELGVDMIWLNPIYKSPNDDNGYDISDYRDIMDEFGTMNDFDDMLKEMHKRGIKLILDLVVNHTSDEHRWFVESRKSKESSYRDYYIWRKGKNGEPPNNWGSVFSGSAWEYNDDTDEYYLHLFSKKQPDLNWENEKVREEIYDMMKFWLDKEIDGFRMDVINFISKDQSFPEGEKQQGALYGNFLPYAANRQRTHEFLKEMNKKVLSQYDIMTVGETPMVTPESASLYVKEDRNELNMVFQFEHTKVDTSNPKWIKKEWKLTDLKKIMSKWQIGLHEKGWNSLYFENHDQPRVVSRFGNDKEYRNESAKMLATMIYMMQGTPYIYQGQEIGMTNVRFDSIEDYKDVEILNAYKELVQGGIMTEKDFMKGVYHIGRDNARTPMQWDDSKNAGFSEGTPWIKVNPNYKDINVKKALGDKNSIFYYYKKLIQIRKENQAIVYGDFKEILEDNENIYAYIRSYEGDIVLVIINFFQNEAVFNLPKDISVQSKELLISNYEVDEKEDIISTKLRPYEARVYKLV